VNSHTHIVELVRTLHFLQKTENQPCRKKPPIQLPVDLYRGKSNRKFWYSVAWCDLIISTFRYRSDVLNLIFETVHYIEPSLVPLLTVQLSLHSCWARNATLDASWLLEVPVPMRNIIARYVRTTRVRKHLCHFVSN